MAGVPGGPAGIDGSFSAVDDDAERLAADNAEKLAGLLEGREGWWFSTQEGEPPHWCFGQDGAARLVITPEPDGFLMFIHDRESWVIPRLESVRAWLDANEQDYAGLTPLQEEYKRALESGEIRPFGEGDGGSPASG
jgi:putative SOS response-associated peptidase YedK